MGGSKIIYIYYGYDLSRLGLRPVPFWVGWNRKKILKFFRGDKKNSMLIFKKNEKKFENHFLITFFFYVIIDRVMNLLNFQQIITLLIFVLGKKVT